MNNHRAGVDTSQFDVICYEQLNKMAHDQGQRPAWKREEVIRQFQGIDGSTRSAAEMQLDTLERSFQEVFSASPPNGDRHR